MKIFHISQRELCADVLHPRLPERTLDTENCTIPRICCAKSITDCIRGANHVNANGIVYFVYEAVIENTTVILNSRQLYQLVPDVMFTKECWILSSVKIRLIGKIKVESIRQQPYPIPFNPNYMVYECVKWGWIKKGLI